MGWESKRNSLMLTPDTWINWSGHNYHYLMKNNYNTHNEVILLFNQSTIPVGECTIYTWDPWTNNLKMPLNIMIVLFLFLFWKWNWSLFFVFTLQHNRVAKIKNHHLLDIAHSIIFDMKVLKSYWRDVI